MLKMDMEPNLYIKMSREGYFYLLGKLRNIYKLFKSLACFKFLLLLKSIING